MHRNSFRGEKLRLARLLKGYTQQQLGDAVSTSRQFIHQLEGGIKAPAEDVLHALCESLDVESPFFFSPAVNEVKIDQCHFRKRKTTPVGLSQRVVAFATIFESLLEILHEYLDLPKVNIPEITHTEEKYTNDEVERAAEICRRTWNLGVDTPIAKMARTLENAGIFITHFDGVSDKVDALSVNRRYPIIIRNTAKESVCRMRFDLAHEFGHFVLHEGIETGDPQTESEADKFASAFIFPRSAFLREFPDMKDKSRIDWRRIYSLKVRWGMSARAIVFRANYLGRITSQQYRWANVWLNKTGQARAERHDDKVVPDNPEILERAFVIMQEQLGIGGSQIAKNLGISKHHLEQITSLKLSDEEHLRNVVPIR